MGQFYPTKRSVGHFPFTEMSDWHGTVYAPNPDPLDTSAWQRLRAAILARDRLRCALCWERKRAYDLSAHHVLARRLGGQDDPDNLITLCHGCHDLIEAQDFENADVFWTFVHIWQGSVLGLEVEHRPAAPDDDWRRWVYGGYRRPD